MACTKTEQFNVLLNLLSYKIKYQTQIAWHDLKFKIKYVKQKNLFIKTLSRVKFKNPVR